MDLSIELFGKRLDNPIFTASGCFACGREASAYQDLKAWGGLVSTAITREERLGNPGPRVCETASGLLNSVGLQNPGIDYFLMHDLPFMLEEANATIVNVAGSLTEDYVYLCEKLDDTDIFAIELNLSCPNVKHGGMAIGTHCDLLENTVSACRKVTSKPLIAKLTPNITDITEAARAAESGGADAISLVNTFLGMAIDLKTQRPVLKNNTGGLSGPCIKPLALRMVADVYRSVSIPVIGLGGITCGKDILEFMLAGARVVQVGSANFAHPHLIDSLRKEMREEMDALEISSLDAWIGSLNYWKS